MTHHHNSKEFFINKRMILVRPLDNNESVADRTCENIIATGDYAVIGEIDFPVDEPLKHYGSSEAGSAAVFTAISAEADHDPAMQPTPIGIALYVKNPITMAHELSIMVHKDYVAGRLPLELLDALVIDAAENGVRTLSTTDTSDDVHMRYIADKTGMSVRLDSKHFRQTRYTLQVDKHPGVVVF